MHSAVGIENNVGQQIRDDQGIVLRPGSIFHNITVPVQQGTVVTVEFTDLEALFEIITGTTMGKSGLGIQSLPFGQNIIVRLLHDNVIL